MQNELQNKIILNKNALYQHIWPQGSFWKNFCFNNNSAELLPVVETKVFPKRPLRPYVLTRRNWRQLTNVLEMAMLKGSSQIRTVDKCLHAREREVKEGDAVLLGKKMKISLFL